MLVNASNSTDDHRSLSQQHANVQSRTTACLYELREVVEIDECRPLHAPAQGRQREEQASPPPLKKKQEGGGGKGTKTAHSRQTARQQHQRRPNPPPERHGRQDPQRGTGGPPTQNRQHQARNSGPPGKGTPKRKKKKKRAISPARKKGDGGTGTTKPGTGKKKEKTKAPKTHPDNPAKKGWAQPRPGPSTHAHTARRNRKWRGASGAPTKRHTSHKQAETEAQPRTPQIADTRGTTPQTVPKHTHPRPQPGLAGLTNPTPNRQPDPNTNAAQQ